MHFERIVRLFFATCLTVGLIAGAPALAADAPKAPATKDAPKAEPAKDAPKADSKVEEVTCAVSGEKFVPNAKSTKSEYKGKTYWFCCPGCKKKFDADPEKYVAKLAPAAAPAAVAAPAAATATTGEVACAVSGEKFVPKADSPKSEYKGKTYTFCCPGCKKKFDADPEKFIKAGAKDDKPCADCGDKGKDGKPCNGDCEDKGAKGGKDDKPCHGDAKCACGHKDCKGDCKDCKECKGKDAKGKDGKGKGK